jgi:hypothetical protein
MPIPTLWELMGYIGVNTLTRLSREARIRGSDGGYKCVVVEFVTCNEASCVSGIVAGTNNIGAILTATLYTWIT